MQDIRLEIRQIAEETRDLIRQERELSLRIVMNIAVLHRRDAERNMGPIQGRIWDFLGLTEALYWKRCQMARVVVAYPVLQKWVASGEVSLTHVAMVAGKITDANSSLVLTAMREKSTRDLRLFLARVAADGTLRPAEETREVTLRLTRAQLDLLGRCREVLAHGGKVPGNETVLETALNDLLLKRDALQEEVPEENFPDAHQVQGTEAPAVPEAPDLNQPVHPDVPVTAREITEARIQGMQALGKHAQWLASGGQCMHVFEDGSRCAARMMLEIDHIHMRRRGGGDEEANLRLVCRRHNEEYASDALGRDFAARFGLPSVKSLDSLRV